MSDAITPTAPLATDELVAKVARLERQFASLKEQQERDDAEYAEAIRERDRALETLAFQERNTLPELRRAVEHHEAGKQRWRERAEKAEAERDALQKRLHDAAMAKVWTNEDGKKFVFVEDIAPALLGITPGIGVAR